MRPHQRTYRLLAAVVLASACNEPTSVVPGPLVGTWVRAPENLSPAGWYQIHLTFTTTGGFTSDVRNHGVYPGQAGGELSSYSRIEGTYRTEGDRLIITPRRLVTWDRFYGPASPEVIQEAYPYTGYLDAARFAVRGETLTLEYTSYPLDAPVPTTMVLTRER